MASEVWNTSGSELTLSEVCGREGGYVGGAGAVAEAVGCRDLQGVGAGGRPPDA